MKTPEKSTGEEKKDFTEKWWEKWLELFGNFLGVKDLEKTVTGLVAENDAVKVRTALESLQGEDKVQKKDGFIRKLMGLLLQGDEKRAEIDQLLEATLGTKTDNDSKEVVKNFGKALDKKGKDDTEYSEARNKVNEKRDRSLGLRERKLKDVGLDKDAEIDKLRQAIDAELDTPRVLTEDEKEQKVADFWNREEENLIREKITGKHKIPTGVIAAKRTELQVARNLYESITKGVPGRELADHERKILNNVLVKYVQVASEEFEIIAGMLEKKLKKEDFYKLVISMSDGETDQKGTTVNLGVVDRPEINKRFATILERLLHIDKAINPGGKKVFDENNWEQMRVSGMLNINSERYGELSLKMKDELHLTENPLVVDEQRKTATVNKKLTKEQKEKVNKFIRKMLISEVRMMVDESVQINNSNIDARATEYVTMMSIMGLNTSMKSDVMNSARRMTFSFMIFNTPQTKEGYQQICEYAAQIGPEYSVLEHVMKLRESITVELEGKKEVELTDLSQIDFVNVASQAILDKDDRKHYNITEGVGKVGRTYADMLMASNVPEERSKDRIPVMRMVLKEKLGPDGYKAMIERIVGENMGPSDEPMSAVDKKALETEYLKAAGDKYWDYFNGIYAYYLMTRSSGEFVGNANPDNSKFKLPAGLNENFNFKMDPSAWAMFQYSYNVPNFPEIIQLLRFNGNSSLASKEGGEVLSYMTQITKDGVTKLPTIADAWYQPGNAPDKEKMAKLREVFVRSVFLPDQIKLKEKSSDLTKKSQADLAKKSHIYETLPLKYEYDKDSGKLIGQKLDATAQRRDFASARQKMVEGLTQLQKDEPSIFTAMNFEFLKTEFAHDEVLLAVLNSDVSDFDKVLAFANRYGEDKLMFKNLSNKRPDDFTKYAIDYHNEWQQAATALAAKPTWAMYIKMMGVVERIVGKGEKMDPIALRGFEYMVELRKARVWNESYIRQIQKDGQLSYQDGNYVGELPGHFPIPDLEERRVALRDIQENGGKPPSIVSIAGGKGEVDEEGAEQQMLGAMKMASLLTEETYKHERKHLAKSHMAWHKDRPFTAELWDAVTGKKIINYLAIEVFDMPPEYFLEMVIGGTGDFVKMWWKYLSGGSGGH